MSKVTIISGVYNAEKYLKECLDSIINQSYQNLEIILIVNASKDKSKEIVQQYEKNILRRSELFIRKKNWALVEAENLVYRMLQENIFVLLIVMMCWKKMRSKK